ncbi:MAG: hypothetical protein H6641_07905 [Caldilineaceae bacterium]|nr:hypothetical protein [Caldilineaceae bacterium]
MLRNKVTGLILGGIAALGITAGATTAFAQSTDATAPAVQSAAGADTLANNELAPRGPGMGNRGAVGGEMLANALGITQAELQTAMQKIPELAIAKAVENGDITQEQADQMTQGNGMRGLMALGVNIDQDALLAEALGITPEALTTARDNAIPMAVEAGLLTQAQANDLLVQKMIRDAVQAAREDALKQAVEQGLLTQAQADRMLEQDRGFGGDFGGQRAGGRGMRGNSGPGAQGAPGMQGPGMRNGSGNQQQQQQQQGQNDSQSSFPSTPNSTTGQNSQL